jgi:hypothetical protein
VKTNILLCLLLFLFSLFYWYVASAYTVGLIREVRTGDGYKTCVYDDGITLRIRASEICPLRMEI